MQDEVSKGSAAQRILEDSVFQEAVSAVSKTLVEEWSLSENTVRREELWSQQKALTKVIENLTAYMQNGEMQKRITNNREGFFR